MINSFEFNRFLFFIKQKLSLDGILAFYAFKNILSEGFVLLLLGTNLSIFGQIKNPKTSEVIPLEPIDSIIQFQKLETTRAIISSLSHESFGGRNMREGNIEITKSFIERFLSTNGIRPLIGGVYRNKFKFDQHFIAENIVGVIDNITPKNEYILLCANYDHLGSGASYEPYPNDSLYNGANDNASGCAMLMQVAKYLAKHKFQKKVLIVFFAGKHEGNYGAGYFADFAKRNNLNIKAVINFEMVGKKLPNHPGKAYMYDNELSNLSFEINYALKERFIVEPPAVEEDDIIEVEPKQDHRPFYNIYGIPSNTITTFDSHTDQVYMSVKDDETNIDFLNLHKIINKVTYAIYHILYHNTSITNSPEPVKPE